MSSELITLEDLSKLKPIECPKRGGINYPCVICKECEIGAVTLTFGDGYLVENTVNSILIHMNLDMNDEPLEEAALKFLKQSLSKQVAAIQKGDWEEGDMAIMLTNEMVKDDSLVNQVAKFVNNFPKQYRQYVISAKRTMTKWSESESKQLVHRYFK